MTVYPNYREAFNFNNVCHTVGLYLHTVKQIIQYRLQKLQECKQIVNNSYFNILFVAVR